MVEIRVPHMAINAEPVRITGAVVHGGHIFVNLKNVGTSWGGFVQIDLRTHEAQPVFAKKGERPAAITVSREKAYVVAFKDRTMRVYEVDLKTRKITEAFKESRSVVSHIVNDRLYCVRTDAVEIVSLSNGETIRTIKFPSIGGIVSDCGVVKDRLYLSRSYPGGLAVIDLKAGKRLYVIPVKHWLHSVDVVGKHAFVKASTSSSPFGVIDLESKKYLPIESVLPHLKGNVRDVHVEQDGSILVATPGTIYRYNARRELTATAPVSKGWAGANLTGVWDDRVVLTRNRSIYLVKLNKVTAPPGPPAGHKSQ